jgi:hypothetical protein
LGFAARAFAGFAGFRFDGAFCALVFIHVLTLCAFSVKRNRSLHAERLNHTAVCCLEVLSEAHTSHKL